MLQAISLAYCMAPLVSNYGVVNLSNLYNFIISVININDSLVTEGSNKQNIPTKELVQLIKLHLGLTIFEGLKQYALKKYPPSHGVIAALES